MAFHRKLTGADLHAPSILQIENFGTEIINRGDVLYVVGYNEATRRYLVNRVVDATNTIDSSIYGIAIESTSGPLDKGTMTAFGIAEELEVVLTPNVANGPNIPISVNSRLYIDTGITSSNLGRLVTGTLGTTVEAGVIIKVTGTSVVTAFVFTLTSDLRDAGPNRSSITKVTFEPSDWVDTPAVDPIERVLTLTHSSSKLDIVAQFFEYSIDPFYKGGTLDVDWKPDSTDPFNVIVVTIPFTVPAFAGYVEIVY